MLTHPCHREFVATWAWICKGVVVWVELKVLNLNLVVHETVVAAHLTGQSHVSFDITIR